MSRFLSELAPLAWTQLWQVTTVALIVLLLVRMFCKHRPHLAYVLLLLVVVKCFTPPIWSSPVGVFSWNWALPTNQNPMISPTTNADEKIGSTGLISKNINQPVADAQAKNTVVTHADLTHTRKALGLEAYLLIAWACGVVVCGTCVAATWLRHLSMIRKTSRMPPDHLTTLCQQVSEKIGLKRPVRLFVNSQSYGPFCFGTLLPSIVFPEQFVSNARNKNIEPILAHELIHIRRGDTWTAMLQVLAGIVWWFHPLIWLVSRRMTRAREKCCDEEVVANMECNPEEYAQSMLEVLKLNRSIEPAFLVSGIRPVDVTKERLESIMNRRTVLHARTPWLCWLILVVGAMLVVPAHSQDVRSVVPDASPDEGEIIHQEGLQTPVSEEAFWKAVRKREKTMRSFELEWERYNATLEDARSIVAAHGQIPNDNRLDNKTEKPGGSQWKILVDGNKIRLVRRGDIQVAVGDADGNHIRTSTVKDVTRMTIFNGSTTKRYSFTPDLEHQVGPEEDQIGSAFFENVEIRPILLCFRLDKYLSWNKNKKDGGPVTVSKEYLDGKEYITASWTIGTHSPSYTRKVWFDASRNYLPIRERDGIEHEYLEWDIQYICDEEGRYTLKGWTAISTWDRPKPHSSDSDIVPVSVVTKWLANPPVPESAFDFPPGTHVSNNVIKTK